MVHVLALFPNTIDQEVSNDLSTKITLTFKQAKGLQSLKMSKGHIMSPGGPPPYSKVIQASFDSLASFMDWVQTPAAQADRDSLVENGIVRIFYEVNEL